MNKSFRTALVLASYACASLLLTVPATAQSVYGSLFGTVSDKTGAAVAGATVTIKDEAKGTVVTVTSNASGDYTVPHLIPDVYDLKVTARGFKAFEAKGISVEADTAPRIDPTLDVGGSSETVEVNADTQPQLKTESTDVSTVFDQQQVASLPVGDQNFTNLQLLLPGAQLLGWSHAADENPQGSKQIQVDGQAFGGTAFELDGTDNEDPILGIIVINPALDSVTETKITTQNFDAELGKAVSAVVTAQTKSGTNNFHGSLYDFRTGNANYARDPYSETPGPVSLTNPQGLPPGLKNRFGASIGGPIIKDRLFFFGNYEAQRQKVGTSATDTLPTNLLTQTALGLDTTSAAQVAAGYKGADFSEYLTQFGLAGTLYPTTAAQAAAAGITLAGPGQAQSPYPHNVVPASLISSQAVNLLTVLQPYTTGVGLGVGLTGSENGLDENYKQSGTGLFNSNQWTERADYTINEKMHAFERFSRFWDVLSGTTIFGAGGGPGFGINNYGGTSQSADDSLASGMDIAISPKLLTDFRLGYYRYNIGDQKHDASVNEATALGMPGLNVGGDTGGSPGFNITDVPGGGGGTTGTVYGDGLGINRCNCPLTEREDQFQIVNNWTRIIGNHAVKVGADLRYGRNLRVPSDSDRTGQISFGTGPESWPGIPNAANGNPQPQGGLGFASLLLGDATSFGRYVSTSTNAKEFQKRTFFYGQDTWRASHKLTLNLGVRWDMYFPETANGTGNGALLNIADGYLHVAGIGGVPSDLGWSVDKAKQFSPRLGVTYQLDPKTVIRVGYGRSFDTGVFGSTFGHTITQNIPVLANQSLNSPTNVGAAFNLAAGPVAEAFPAVPANGLLPNPGASVESSSRPNPMHLTTIDAWNLSVQRALTPTLSLTAAYVGNKGTHTLGDGDSNGTNPNEAAVIFPGADSITGQTLHFDPSVASGQIAANGGTSTNNLMQRYFTATLPACSDPNYVSPGSPYAAYPLPAGACGWTQGIAYRGDDQNTEFDALQVTLTQSMKNGLTMTANYEWASSFNELSGYYTWSHSLVHQRDDNVRNQQLVMYGSYDFPFGKGKQYLAGVGRAGDLVVGGWQLSDVTNWSGGLPFTLSYNESGKNINDGPGDPSETQKMVTSTSKFNAVTKSRCMFDCTNIGQPAHSLGDGTFVNPGLDTFGNAGLNTYLGPRFFSDDIGLTKAFTLWENIAVKFRMDAFNVFNHITAGNPGGSIETGGQIGGEGGGCGSGNDCGPRQLEFSLHVQF